MDTKVSPLALQDDDARYRLLVDAITDYAIYMLDPEGRVTSWNAGAQRLKGYKASEVIGSHFSRFYTEEDRAVGRPTIALQTAAAEGRFESEGWRVRKDGARFWVHVLIDPIRTPEGELIGYAKITRDLTERRAAEETLRRSEEQFRLLVQGVTDYAIYMLDRDGRVSSWNAGAQRIKGYRPEEIIGQHFSRFYSEADRAAGEPAVALNTARSEGRFEKEGWRVRKDGTRFWAHVVIDAIRNDAGEIIGFAKITRDITERMKAQAALEVARQTLFQSQKLEALGQLTGGIAHDFNNLLTAVLGSLDMLRRRLPPDPKAVVLIDNATLGAQRGAALTQRMLAFARKQELTLEGVDVPALVRGVVDLLRPTLGPSIELVTRLPPVMAPAFSDADQLAAALLNLAVNARDAMPSGGRITIEAEDCLGSGSALGLPDGDYVRLTVTDTGEGMDKETLARATEPFFTTKGVGKGTGLGLSMVHGLAEQSGGRLVLSSRPGQGARIEILLRRASEVASQKPSADDLAEEQGPSASHVVLVVDDDALVLINAVAMLEELGHEVVAADSAVEALAILEHRRVDLVITDHAMPQMTGLALAREIGFLRPGLRVVLSTGYAELPAGVADALPRLAKPYNQADLARIVREMLPQPRTAAAEP